MPDMKLGTLLEEIEARSRRHSNPEELAPVPSHGDYKWDQFLYHRGQFALIDFESFGQAEPAYDPGTFCAYLPPASPHDWREAAAAERLRDAFLQSYAGAAPKPASWLRISLIEAATLALRGFAFAWAQRQGWELQASQLVDLAFERLANPRPAAIPTA